MSLKRVGGKSDGGVDLLGWWWLPLSSDSQSTPITPPRRRIRVLAQCKAEKKKFSPNYVREMEGVWHMHAQDRSPSGSPTPVSELGTVALLLSESKFTTATLTRALGSSVPFLLMHLPPPPLVSSDPDVETTLGEVGSAFWNPALGGAQGLLRGELDVRWERDLGGGGRPGLWCLDICLVLGSSEVHILALADRFGTSGDM
ncbi:uncharacterized protein BJ212DRAFT_1571147 [Suillus subaureus]|uniref:Restriction endonuclease type IV Mrr domain-containing protein n=1 Tax=Suillus subaureus TaxID=48587 RepID=A0A9P7DU59_9AGAM|nr:uncharacterized protein BJ212DRAFT_1571147 [Suillus subaureus]KAG1803348.1 hypothetical protein BJ212DRAFT_1571147 [Suillus subaureus]